MQYRDNNTFIQYTVMCNKYHILHIVLNHESCTNCNACNIVISLNAWFRWMTPTYNKQEWLVIFNKTISNNNRHQWLLALSACTINTLIKYTFDHIFIYYTLCTGPPLDYTFLSSSQLFAQLFSYTLCSSFTICIWLLISILRLACSRSSLMFAISSSEQL